MADIVRATRADVYALADVLADAYEDDPIWEWLVPRERVPRLRRFFRDVLAMQADRGRLWTDIDRTVAAVWCPPGEWKVGVGDIVRNIPVLVRTGRTRLPLLLGMLQHMESKHPVEPEHWYLEFIGTHSSARGTGRGALVLSALLEQADASGQPAYLESSNERNLTFYKRHGFALREEMTYRSSPPMWRMWREATTETPEKPATETPEN
ncbi:GNAT family N-acetyltransferase [Streptomyces sp. TRM66268-LWL]|uniref:GNAT family N-acetyltransferase n=1 Tax=Streptomyces polyasparticus TaxID=2767826 RepID=A0ABR7SDC6_9ACTN|nr:GNAT family N-acetyltransferase [Streptomyces polyasparticus]MBC9712602.1 GNAT family N-acetyltransferase [Streptomyces polyasparticus]